MRRNGVLGLSLSLLLATTASRAIAEQPFVFVALPDTQVYAQDRVPDGRLPAVTDPRGTGAIFFDQTRWIVDNADELSIRYVGHLGDIVQDGNNLDEWALANQAMGLLLEADIPHGTVMGNHDDNHPPDYQRNYLTNFGPQVFAGRSWYTASSPGGGANLQLMEHRHRKIGFLNFSIDHPQSEIDWATQIVQDNPDAIFIIGTHRYLYDFKLAGGRFGEDVATQIGVINLPQGEIEAVIEPNSAEELFNEFVTQHPNILMIHAGHFHSEWLRLDGENSAAQTVLQILTDYQSTRNGGDGWLRIYELDFDENTLHFDTYSPTLERRRSTIDHFVETIFLAYDQRQQVMDVLGVNEAQYFALLDFVFKRSGSVPDDFLLQHPDLDEPEEQAYFEQYLNELFLGDPPPGFDNIHDWENMWMIGFAADPDDPFDFTPFVRSPSLTLPVDFSAYFVPTPDQLVAFSFEALRAALAGLDDDDLLFGSAGLVLDQYTRHALRQFKRGRKHLAKRILRRRVLQRTDGCAERGRPDGFWGFWWWFLQWFSLDFIDRCEAQGEVYPHVVEVLERLKASH